MDPVDKIQEEQFGSFQSQTIEVAHSLASCVHPNRIIIIINLWQIEKYLTHSWCLLSCMLHLLRCVPGRAQNEGNNNHNNNKNGQKKSMNGNATMVPKYQAHT